MSILDDLAAQYDAKQADYQKQLADYTSHLTPNDQGIAEYSLRDSAGNLAPGVTQDEAGLHAPTRPEFIDYTQGYKMQPLDYAQMAKNWGISTQDAINLGKATAQDYGSNWASALDAGGQVAALTKKAQELGLLGGPKLTEQQVYDAASRATNDRRDVVNSEKGWSFQDAAPLFLGFMGATGALGAFGGGISDALGGGNVPSPSGWDFGPGAETYDIPADFTAAPETSVPLDTSLTAEPTIPSAPVEANPSYTETMPDATPVEPTAPSTPATDTGVKTMDWTDVLGDASGGTGDYSLPLDGVTEDPFVSQPSNASIEAGLDPFVNQPNVESGVTPDPNTGPQTTGNTSADSSWLDSAKAIAKALGLNPTQAVVGALSALLKSYTANKATAAGQAAQQATQKMASPAFTSGLSALSSNARSTPVARNVMMQITGPTAAWKPAYKAQGGLANYMSGGTPGTADKVPAMLSDGEFVVPADVVAHLGDGNNKAGALKLHAMMTGVRQQKTGKANGLPPKAKAPEQYMKGAR